MITQRLSNELDLVVRRKLHIKFDLRQIHAGQLDKPIDIRSNISCPFEAPSYSASMVLFHPFKASPERHTCSSAFARRDKEKRWLGSYTDNFGHYLSRWRGLPGLELRHGLAA